MFTNKDDGTQGKESGSGKRLLITLHKYGNLSRKGQKNLKKLTNVSFTYMYVYCVGRKWSNVREHLPKNMFSFGHCPNEGGGGEALARIKKYTLYIHF